MNGDLLFDFDELPLIHGLSIMAYGKARIEYSHDEYKIVAVEISGYNSCKHPDRQLDPNSYEESMLLALISGSLDRYHEIAIWEAIHEDWSERLNEYPLPAWFEQREESRP